MREYNKNPIALQKKKATQAKRYRETVHERRDWRLRYAYGISKDQYDQMLSDQGNVCAVCETPESACGKSFAVDHCHETGIVRGLLCSKCNLSIGHANDDPERLRALADYLERTRIARPYLQSISKEM